ncbi:PP2C family protein-serine/threonine phosphatase [Nocardioides sp. SYSU DS0663]|uniref:PP2C family protein-serine/threonine phosphatase n=1 Tax=Nocardioides sp. SYSU DS0663 TaxID=3416445 RepID=UPI003F4B9C12
MLRFVGSGVSDVGLVRSNNEDSGFVGGGLCLVADGVGGAAAGEVASATAAQAFLDAVASGVGDPEEVFARATDLARAGIRRAIQRDLSRLGMATTLTAVLSDGDRVVLGHVGDSRAYRLRGGTLVRLSTDHTYVAHLLESGQLRAGDLARHPWRNVVLRSLDGDPAEQEIDVVAVDVVVGDRLLLCSDGLSDLVSEERIAELLGGPRTDDAARLLLEEALAAGGRDNVTCVVVDVVEDREPPTGEDAVRLGALTDAANVVQGGALRSP